MPTVRGRAAVRSYIAQLPAELETKVLRGAARAGAKVVADEIRLRTPSQDVREALRTRLKADDGQIVVRIDLKPGWGRSVGVWMEYGTEPHFITVDDSQREGMSAARINKLQKTGSLVIGGKFVGETVFHTGARPYPAFRPARDIKAGEAIAAAQSHINARITRSGIVGTAEPGGGEL